MKGADDRFVSNEPCSGDELNISSSKTKSRFEANKIQPALSRGVVARRNMGRFK